MSAVPESILQARKKPLAEKCGTVRSWELMRVASISMLAPSTISNTSGTKTNTNPSKRNFWDWRGAAGSREVAWRRLHVSWSGRAASTGNYVACVWDTSRKTQGTSVREMRVAPTTPAPIATARGGQNPPPLRRRGKNPTTVVAVVART